MTQPTPEEILEMAQKHVADRKQQVVEKRAERESPWRYAFFGLIGAVILGLFAWPGASLDFKMYAAVHGFCAQIHNVEVGGQQLPICARNTGIYSSFLLTLLFLAALGRGRAAKLPPLPITVLLAVFVIIMGVDGVNSTLRDMLQPHLYTPMNWLRTLTGTGMGIAIAVLLLLVFNMSLRSAPDTETRILKNWLELGAVLGINLAVVAAMYGNISFMYWPIAFSAWIGITGVLYLVNVIVSALVMGYDGRVSHLGQLAKPASLAVVFTAIQLGIMGSLRFWAEGQGLIVG